MAEARPLDLGGVLPLHRDSTPAVLHLNCSGSKSALLIYAGPSYFPGGLEMVSSAVERDCAPVSLSDHIQITFLSYFNYLSLTLLMRNEP